MSYRVQLEIFEGPLDLLLHLVKKNEVEITDIAISLITDQYLSYLNLMRELELDIAGEYLVMAATLTHIKSRMLLPSEETEFEEDEDPRTELVRQLIEYRKFKEAAYRLDQREILYRDVFVRAPADGESSSAEPRPLECPGLFELLLAFRDILKRTDATEVQAIRRDSISIQDRIHAILESLRDGGTLAFDALFHENHSRSEVVVTFLALLELVKLKLVTVVQRGEFEEIWLRLAVEGNATTVGSSQPA